jgi:hypothetical protein
MMSPAKHTKACQYNSHLFQSNEIDQRSRSRSRNRSRNRGARLAPDSAHQLPAVSLRGVTEIPDSLARIRIFGGSTSCDSSTR